jgi:U2-associated protein SR140
LHFKNLSFKPAEKLAEDPKTITIQDKHGETPMDISSDMDGEPLDDSINGEPLENVDSETLDNIDNIPFEDDIDSAPLEDDVDSAPLQEDLDGVPMEDGDGEPIF